MGEVLMVGWMNAESLGLTLRDGFSTFWSRSRQELWRKGETSGCMQEVREVLYDCDGDTLLVVTGAGSKVDPVRRGLGTVAYLSNYSWVRMTQYARGLSFEIIDRQGGSRYRYDLSR